MSATPLSSGRNDGTLKSGTSPSFGLNAMFSRFTTSICSPFLSPWFIVLENIIFRSYTQKMPR